MDLLLPPALGVVHGNILAYDPIFRSASIPEQFLGFAMTSSSTASRIERASRERVGGETTSTKTKERLLMTTYLVTGACGFIGSNFVHDVLDREPEATSWP